MFEARTLVRYSVLVHKASSLLLEYTSASTGDWLRADGAPILCNGQIN